MVSKPKVFEPKVFEPKEVARRRKLRDALIGAAERTIAAEGLRGMKARELAFKVGCAVGAIYNVFTDLDDLIFAVNALTLEQLEKTLTVASRDSADPQADAIKTLVHLGLAYTDYAASHTQRWRALFDHRLPEGRDIPTWYRANLHRLFDYIEQPLRKLAAVVQLADYASVFLGIASGIDPLAIAAIDDLKDLTEQAG